MAATGAARGAQAATAGYRPAALWACFEALTRIPRPSKHEGAVTAFLEGFAEARGLTHAKDAVGNLVVRRPGSGGGEGAPAVVIQGHTDMVCEKNSDTVFDFFKDALVLKEDPPGWLRAEGTTLGADNGMGVATAMALLDCDQTVKLPPLECLFTVDEETGLTGAFGLDGSLVTGRTLLNLDTEEWGSLYIGCAGGGESELFLRDPQMEPAPEGHATIDVALKGLRGGHSGCDIHNYRGNALVLLARAVAAVRARCPGGRLASLLGGDKHNAIPREAFATLTVPEGDLDAAREVLEEQLSAFKEEYGREEPGLELSAENAAGPAGGVLSEANAAGFIDLLTLLPYGPMKMSHAVEGLVETSSNVASVKLLGDGRSLEIVCSTRSSLTGALEAVRAKIAAAGRLCGFEVKQDPAYPGWNPNPSSEVVALAKEVLGEMTGKTPEVLAIHAGLECGIIGEKCPGTDMVSYGPTICNPHTPEETVKIETVEPFFDLTLKLLQRLADRKA
mgnify:FL=1